MHSRVDPSTSLRQQHLKLVRYDCLTHSLRDKNLFTLREGLKHECGQVSVLTKEEEILCVQCIDNVLRVVFDDVRVGKDRDPVVLAALGGLDTVHAETTGETGNTAKDGFESLSQVVGDEVPIHD